MTVSNWPPIIYGTAWKTDKTAALTELALRQGYRAIDTANQPKHYHEPGVGEGLHQSLPKLGIERSEVFLQTKFTPIDGQDHRLPYRAQDSVSKQVEDSFASSLENLKTDYLDSYLLHGPYGRTDLIQQDFEVWSSLEKLYEQKKSRLIGISNVTITHLRSLVAKAKIKPMVVQNRCYANRGWDREVREFCRENDIVYQGFSLLTANPQVVNAPELQTLASSLSITSEQAVFLYAKNNGIFPLTGTTSELHMKQDLAATELSLDPQSIKNICEMITKLS